MKKTVRVSIITGIITSALIAMCLTGCGEAERISDAPAESSAVVVTVEDSTTPVNHQSSERANKTPRNDRTGLNVQTLEYTNFGDNTPEHPENLPSWGGDRPAAVAL